MKCERCDNKAVIEHPNLCKEHFTQYFEKKVEQTIQEFSLIQKTDKVCVAISGGKDSLTVLHLLNKLGYNPEALLIDEGIHGYREKTIIDAKAFCARHHITLHIVSFKDELGKTLDEIMQKHTHPCKICGTFRRYLLNRFSKDYDVIATGHNADDEAQAIMMNILKANKDLLIRLGPKTNPLIDNTVFTQRVKPLYFCSEKEVMTYAFVNKIKNTFTECPNITESFRSKVRDILYSLTQEDPNTRENILRHYLKMQADMPKQENKIKACSICGEPSKGDICKTCQLKEEVLT